MSSGMLRPNIQSWWLLSHCCLGLCLIPVCILLLYPVSNWKLPGAVTFSFLPCSYSTWHVVHFNGIKHTAIPIAHTSEKFLQQCLLLKNNEQCKSFYTAPRFVTLCSCFVILIPSCKVSGETILLFFGAPKSIGLFQEQLLGTSTIKIPYQLSHINCAYFLLI